MRANRHKPRGVEAKESIFRIHLQPRLGKRRLDKITELDIQQLKADLSEKKAKTINNILAVLNKLLKTAVRWRVLESMPLTIDLLKTEPPDIGFYEVPQYRRLVREAREIGTHVLAVVLLGGDAGLRRNEIIALSPLDIDMKRGLITVRHSDWNGALLATKGNRPRVVPMTRVLRAALRDLLDAKRKRLLLGPTGEPLSISTVRTWLRWAQNAAGLPDKGLHVLRHTFCSRLATCGATVLAIRELAGHRSLRTTLRYMHLSPNERNRAIALLDEVGSGIQQKT